MDAKEIKELINLISRSNFAEFEMEREGFKLKLVKQQPAAPGLPGPEGNGPVVVSSAPPLVAPAAETVAQPPPAVAPTDDGAVDLNSPIVGTFYRSPSPDSPPYVDVGSKVKKGQIMCIVEAMKVMNEIESEIDAEVLEIPVSNGQPVEFGEVLFRLRPLA